MTKLITHKFVDTIPDTLEEDTLYISIEYTAVVHKCFCGCGKEVNTPLTPTDWRITYNGSEVSLHPSVGNWNLACKSHYWIEDNTVYFVGRWSKEKIDFAQKHDMQRKKSYYAEADIGDRGAEKSVFQKIKDWLSL